MSSIIQGYEYDIFISYCQKDIKHDGWVTKFVENLKGELEATFKEEISIYFDENPHDHLQDTHDVGMGSVIHPDLHNSRNLRLGMCSFTTFCFCD
jgi:hypothetical protein